MTYEATELEHIEAKLIDGMPIEYWRGVEDGLALAAEMITNHGLDQGPERISAFNMNLELAISGLRDRRVLWLMRMVPTDIYPIKKDISSQAEAD